MVIERNTNGKGLTSMLKLLNAYRDIPTTGNAQKIEAYAHKYPFAHIVLVDADYELFAKAIHHASSHCVADTYGTIQNGKVQYV